MEEPPPYANRRGKIAATFRAWDSQISQDLEGGQPDGDAVLTSKDNCDSLAPPFYFYDTRSSITGERQCRYSGMTP
jgi:hypothetical protein